MGGDQLRVTEGNDRGKLLTIEVDLLIGRSASEDEGRLGGDPRISRRHARVSRGSNGRLAIEDLGSVNGTFVNDVPVLAPRMLVAGDLIRVGNTVLEVVGVSSQLMATAGASLGRRFTVAEELIVGREVDGEGRLSDDPKLSRRHARFVSDDRGRLTVEDLGSANGTFVNGERLGGRRALSAGDSVRVGGTTLEVVAAESAPRQREQAAPAVAAPAPAPAPALAAPAPAPAAPAPALAAPARAPAAPAPAAAAPAARAARQSPAPAVPDAPATERASELALGSVFAGCRVESVINHGDMGVVYGAEELALQRPVALKLIPAEYSRDERFRARFRRESKIAAAIDHPNVLPIFDAGEESDLLYIMMRLVEGTDLRKVIAGERWLEPLRAARIVRQVGAALDAAHARGILHRDVKPSNVLLARRDHVYLSDFGLAKPTQSRDELTRGHTIVARVEYLSPEQILNQPVDARADVYALGCLLFEALTGEPPFDGPAGGGDPLARLQGPPRSVRELRPDLPRAFDDVVRRAMTEDPSERYASAGDLGEAALVATERLCRVRRESMVAVGPAATGDDARVAASGAGTPATASPASRASVPAAATAQGSESLRWAVALSGLVAVAVGMVFALHGISTL
jgi:pSer/pThr/pTyr-binding forkhead associated (FHA) protein